MTKPKGYTTMEPNQSLDLGLKDAGGCSCCAAPESGAAITIEDESNSWEQVQLKVRGMTCSNCVASVTDKVGSLRNVRAVSVQLSPAGQSTITVSSEGEPDLKSIQSSIEEAGYELVKAPSIEYQGGRDEPAQSAS
jgi:copper chaperone CopZ